MAINVTSVVITGIYVSFQGGEISSVQVSYTAAGAAGAQFASTFTWTLSSTEQTNTASFVTALTNKLAAVTGLAVATT